MHTVAGLDEEAWDRTIGVVSFAAVVGLDEESTAAVAGLDEAGD